MKVQCYNSEFEVPDILIAKFTKDFDGLPGSGMFEEVNQIRSAIYEVVDLVAEDPDILDEPDYRSDFIRALAIKQALATHGILYDS
jgi:hypothetical protein